MSKKGRFARRGVRNKTGIGAEELDQVKPKYKALVAHLPLKSMKP